MSSSVIMILLLGYLWILCLNTDTLKTNYFNRKNWFDDGNIFHIDQEQFLMVFQQHRNVNRHINWLANEISSLNHQIKLIKDQVTFVIHTPEQRRRFPQENNSIPLSPKRCSSRTIKIKNHQNIYILKLLSNESIFNGYLKDLIDIYELSLTTTIESLVVFIEQNSLQKYLFIKLSNGVIDKYQINRTKSLKETLWKIPQPIFIWDNIGKQPAYYRRFIQTNQMNELIITDQLSKIKIYFKLYHSDRPKVTDIHFFDMMGQILRIKYHTDPSSLSCILEVFFGNIYTCDGRLIHPHELKLLSDDNNFFVFYAVMMDTMTERQIYPLDTNNHIRYGEQIFFLFSTHPRFNSLSSSLTCPDCSRVEQTYDKDKEIKQNTDDRIIESKSPVDTILQNSFLINPQNYIVYVIVTSILIYILFGIYLSREQDLTSDLGRKHSISSRRGR